ncbi:MAG: c-type cytochrome [Verrucomicrobiales bacterium]|nr:c-type cytochrome [Verrucomicrobiales bacterium]
MLSKLQAKVFFLGGTAVFSGIFLVLTFDTHLKVPEQTHAADITDDVREGKILWEANNCMGCHTLFGEGAYYAPELTKVVERRGRDWIRVFMKNPEAMFPGQRKMVKYDFTPEQVDHVISFLEWCGKVDLNGFPAEPPLRDALQAMGTPKPALAVEGPAPLKKPVPAIFTTATCIGCHQIQGQGGAAGALIGAPPLDDVFRRYDRAKLVAWIKDPPSIKPDTKMPKLYGVAVNDQQLNEIVDYLLSLNPEPAAAPASTPAPAPAPAPAPSPAPTAPPAPTAK